MAEKRPLCNYSGQTKELLETDSLPGVSSSGINYSVINENTNATTGNGYLINASAGNITLTLPGSPSVGDTVAVVDIYNKATTNVITVARNGNRIEGRTEDLVFDVVGAGFILVYADATRGWEIVSEVGIGSSFDNVNKVGFDTTPSITPGTEGQLYYDELWKTLALESTVNHILRIGQEEHRRVYNAGSKIYTGQPVYSNGVYSSGLPHCVTVALAYSTTAITANVLGIASHDIEANSYGCITIRGHINNIKTDYSGWVSGDSIYLGSTAGTLTNVKPEAPNFEFRVGRVIDVHATAGIINVRISQAYQLDNLTDVSTDGVVVNQILKFNGVSWVPADAATTASAGGTNYFLTDSDTPIEGMTRANPCVVTWTNHRLTGVGHQVKFEGITQAGWTVLNSVSPAANLWHTATILNENTFSIPVNTTGYSADYNPTTDPGTYNKGKLLTSPDASLSESIDEAQSTGDVEALIDSYATSLPIGRTSIDGGEWTFDTWCYCSSTTDTNVIVIRVYKRATATGVETELFNTQTSDLGTVATLSRIASLQPAFSIATTDHLVIKYFAKSNRGSGLYRQFFLIHGGVSRYSLVKTPIAVAHNQLGGLNTTGYRHLPAATADNDFAVGQASDGNWIKKTLAETKTVLGLGSAAYTDSTAYDPAGTAAGKIAASISDGDTTHAPDGNSVYDALAAKAPNLLTGFTSGAGTVAATDNVLQAIQKLDGNIAGIEAGGTVGLFELDLNGNIVPDDGTNTDEFWEVDVNGNLIPKVPGGETPASKYFGAVFDGGGSAIAADKKCYVRIPNTGTIVAAYIMADVSGTISVEVWKDTFSNFPPTVADKISASAPIALSSATHGEDTTLTGWTKTVTAGDVLCFNVSALATSITWCAVGVAVQ